MSDAWKLGWSSLFALMAFASPTWGGAMKYGPGRLNFSNSYYQNASEGSVNLRWRVYSASNTVTNLAALNATQPAAPASAPVAAPAVAAAPTLDSAPVTVYSLRAMNAPVSTATAAPVSAPSYSAPVQSIATPAPAPAPAVPQPVDAFLNFGPGPFASSDVLNASAASPWYSSSVVQNLFGGVPNSSQQQQFASEVASVVQKVYQDSGVPISVTTDPNRPSEHTMSLVSNAGDPTSANTIGLTEVGQSGMTFVDRFKDATSVDQLATAVGHNMAHELMHAFGVADHPANGDGFVDSEQTSWSLLTDPNARFSPEATQAILALQSGGITNDSHALGAQLLDSNGQVIGLQAGSVTPATVPEPTTIMAWLVGGVAVVAFRRRKS